MFDWVRRAYEEIIKDCTGWGTLICLAAGVLLARLSSCFSSRDKTIGAESVTTFVNAAVVGGTENELQN